MYHTVWDGHILWDCINVQLQRIITGRLKKFLQRMLRRLEVQCSDLESNCEIALYTVIPRISEIF